jgi:hypothetical protein
MASGCIPISSEIYTNQKFEPFFLSKFLIHGMWPKLIHCANGRFGSEAEARSGQHRTRGLGPANGQKQTLRARN